MRQLLPHLWNLLCEETLSATIEFGENFYVEDPKTDAERTRDWTRGIISEIPLA